MKSIRGSIILSLVCGALSEALPRNNGNHLENPMIDFDWPDSIEPPFPTQDDITINQSSDDYVIVNKNQPIIFHQSRDKNFKLPAKFLKAIGPIIAGGNFYISVDVKQKPRNHGTIFRLSESQNGALLLEITADARKKRLKLRYAKRSEKGAMGHVSAKYDLSNENKLHLLQIQFIANQEISISIDCLKVLSKNNSDFRTPSDTENPSLFGYLGQRNRYDSYFVGKMQTFYVGRGFEPQNLTKCPKSTSDLDSILKASPATSMPSPTSSLQNPSIANCPECWEALNVKVSHLMNEMTEIRDRVDQFDDRIKGVQLVQRGCNFEGVKFEHGQSSRNETSCTECTCTEGAIYCRPIGCPKLSCPNPEVSENGSCCPICKLGCQYMGAKYDHGEVFWPNKKTHREATKDPEKRQCVRCECSDSDTTCRFEKPDDCPTLECPKANQILPQGSCCPICKLGDYCRESPCHTNATCTNHNYTRECKCKEGFFGDGVSSCFDIDECQFDSTISDQLGGCGLGARCINTPGSFRCECLTGFVQIDERNCLDILLYR